MAPLVRPVVVVFGLDVGHGDLGKLKLCNAWTVAQPRRKLDVLVVVERAAQEIVPDALRQGSLAGSEKCGNEQGSFGSTFMAPLKRQGL